MTNDLYLSLDLYKIVSDYSGVNQYKFPPTTIQILNALTAYIKDYDSKVDKLQERVDNLTAVALPNYVEMEAATSGATSDSVVTLNGVAKFENDSGQSDEGEYHISIPTDGSIKVTGLGKLGVDFVEKYYKQVWVDATSSNGVQRIYITFSYISNTMADGNLEFTLQDMYNSNPQTLKIRQCVGELRTDTGTNYNIYGISFPTSIASTVNFLVSQRDITSQTALIYAPFAVSSAITSTITTVTTPIFVPAKTDTV